jgi:hypothetical protein
LWINMSGLSMRKSRVQSPALARQAAPAPLALPDAFQGAPAGARTETLVWRAPFQDKPFIAAGTVAIVAEKISVRLPSRRCLQLVSRLPECVLGCVAGTAGFAGCVYPCLSPSRDSFAAPSNATNAAPHAGNRHCNNVRLPTADENAARIPSTDTNACAGDGLTVGPVPVGWPSV